MAFSLRLIASERVSPANEQKAIREKAAAQIALAQSEHQSKNPYEMRRILNEVPAEYRDQPWAYLDAKFAPPSIGFDIPDAPVEVAFLTGMDPVFFLAIQRNGNLRYLEPDTGFGSPRFALAGSVKEMVFAYVEDKGRARLAAVTNRSIRIGEATYQASLELFEMPSGKSLYKVHDSSVIKVVWHPSKPVIFTCSSKDTW